MVNGIKSDVPQNVKDKLNELKLPEEYWKHMINGIYRPQEIVELKSQNRDLNDIKLNISKLIQDNKILMLLAHYYRI